MVGTIPDLTQPHARRAMLFHRERMAREGFRSGYVQPTLEWTLIKALLAYPDGAVAARGFYYESLERYWADLVATARDFIEARGCDALTTLLIVARRVGLAKDAPLAVTHLLPRERMVDVLSTCAPHLLLRFVEIARKTILRFEVGGLGRRKKTAVAAVLRSWPIEKQESYAIKYRSAMRDLLRLVHPKPPSDEVNALWRWVLGRGAPPTERARAFEEVKRLAAEQRFAEAAELALRTRLPFEVVRSSISFDALDDQLLLRVFTELATPIAAFMHLSVLARRSSDLAVEVARRFAERVPVSYGVKAVVGLAAQGLRKAAERIDELLEPRIHDVVREITLPLRGAKQRAVFLIDVSGSMSGPGIERAASVAYALRGMAAEVLVFSSNAMPPRPIELRSLDDYFALLRMPDGGTPLVPAIQEAAKEARRLDAMLFVFTDEMGNVFDSSNIATIPEDVPTIVFNVAPYPAEHVVKDYGHVVGLPTASIDAARAGVALLQIYQKQSEGVVPAAVIEELARALGI